MRKKGVITVPVELRRKYGLAEGEIFTFVELGEGAFMLTPGSSELARLGDKAAELLREEGVSLEDLLEASTRSESSTTRRNMPEVELFFDSSAMVAGIISPTGGARALLLLAETGGYPSSSRSKWSQRPNGPLLEMGRARCFTFDRL